jgi:polysaccharide export outer membrane protein
MNCVVKSSVLALACCLMQQGLVVAVAQGQQSTLTGGQTGQAGTTKSGAADGVKSPALTGERRPLYRLQKSDVVDVDFEFSLEFNQTSTVQPDGFIALKGVPALYAEGITAPELEEGIRRAYAAILHDPEVTIVLKEFDKPYFIAAGEVGRPGKYELRSDTTVTEAVAIAGGLTGKAKHSEVVLFRRVSNDLVESRILNLKAMLKSRTLAEDIHLRPGDMLFVPQNLISKIRPFMPASSLSMYGNPTQF